MGSAPPGRHLQAYGTAPTGLNRTGENRQALVGHSYKNPQYSHHGPSTPVDQPTTNSFHPGFNRSRENRQVQVGDFGQAPPRRPYSPSQAIYRSRPLSEYPGYGGTGENSQVQTNYSSQNPPPRLYGPLPSWSPPTPFPAFAQRTAMQDPYNYRILPCDQFTPTLK
ncbi:hypothetical protein OCU04_012876 [Sclerotinia nivalis]|uniref:Uncharacterized protein n=1 Tax=Sclerotinia nivalis TaxID=352851 RepID=A0A9X0AA77_9HELO|nr:hypothetical protein OCU04_012876 [Sclerotinia nivalis]